MERDQFAHPRHHGTVGAVSIDLEHVVDVVCPGVLERDPQPSERRSVSATYVVGVRPGRPLNVLRIVRDRLQRSHSNLIGPGPKTEWSQHRIPGVGVHAVG